MPRLFVAVEMPEGVKQHLALLTGGVPGARWVPRDQWHLTLRFVGDADGGELEDLRAELGRVRVPSFALAVRGVGHFPPRGAPTVLWAGVDRSDGLAALHDAVERAVRAAGLPPEDRKFHPHVTLARLKGTPPRRVGEWLSAHGLFEAPPFVAAEFVLFRSTLGSKGALHEVEEAYPLAGSG